MYKEAPNSAFFFLKKKLQILLIKITQFVNLNNSDLKSNIHKNANLMCNNLQLITRLKTDIWEVYVIRVHIIIANILYWIQ